MRTYSAKYDVGQDVYILNDKSIYKTTINKIRITVQSPQGLVHGTIGQQDDAQTGICIEYLVEVNRKQYENSYRIDFDWYNQRDIFETRDELIERIK